MSVCLTKTEIIAGSVDGTVRTFDLRIGRYALDFAPYSYGLIFLRIESLVNILLQFFGAS